MIARLKCWWRGHHTYFPSYMERHLFTAGRHPKHVFKQFQYECETCGKLTEWIKKSDHAQWELDHKPSWSNQP